MTDLGTVLIPALAAIGGVGITALAGMLSSRERYSQRIERLANVRQKVSDNRLLAVRIDTIIHYELSTATFSKRNSFRFAVGVAGSISGYLALIMWIVGSLGMDNTIEWIVPSYFYLVFAVALFIPSFYLLRRSAARKSKLLESTLPPVLSLDDMDRWYANRSLHARSENPSAASQTESPDDQSQTPEAD